MTVAIVKPEHLTGGPRRSWAKFISSWRRNAREVRDDQRFTAIIGVGTALIGICYASLGRGTAVAIWVGLVTLCVTPGCAFVCWHLTRDGLTRAIAVFGASLTWTILVSSLLAWRQVTSLGIVLAATAGVGGLGSAIFLIYQFIDQRGRRPRGRPDLIVVEEQQDRQARTPDRIEIAHELMPGPVPRSHRELMPPAGPKVPVAYRSRSQNVLLLIVLAAAVLLYVFSAIRARGHTVGSWGLLPLLGVPFLIAIGLTVAVLVVGLRFINTAWPIALSALCLLLVEFNGTQVILDAIPLSSWTYKHFGVVDYMIHGGALNNPLDIYQQWPGFFAAAAELARISGSSPLASGNWPHLLFEASCSVVIFAIARRFVPSNRVVPYLTALLFFTLNWEGQYYYSPQSTAFLLALIFQFFMLPSLEPERVRWPFRKWSWLRVPPLEIQGREKVTAVGNATRIVGMIAVFGAIVVTHQISPALVLAGLGGLYILGVLRNPVVTRSVVLVTLFYLLLHVTALQHNIVFNGFSFSNATGKPYITDPSQQQALAARLSQLVGLGTWFVTVICILSYRRRLGIMAIPAILAFAPFSMVLVSDYQGEGIYRVFLFSSPWCALIIARRLADLRFSSMFCLAIAGCWAMFAGLASAQAQDFGMWPMIEVSQAEISASTYFLDHAPPNSVLILGAANFPSRLNGNYVLHNAKGSQNDLSLDEIPAFDNSGLKNVNPKALAGTVASLAGGDGYLVIAPSMEAYEDYYQFVTPGVMPSIIPRLESSAYWQLWYQNDGTFIFHALPEGRQQRIHTPPPADERI
jgi:hypothetical protein